MTFKEAAAVVFGSYTALCFLRRAKVQAGDHVLVYGASGSVGVFAVQLAKHFGARVTGVCSTAGGVAREAPGDLAFIRELIEAGKLKTAIDRRYPLHEIAAAYDYAERGHKKGHVVIVVDDACPVLAR